jgi:hypothetical protein
MIVLEVLTQSYWNHEAAGPDEDLSSDGRVVIQWHRSYDFLHNYCGLTPFHSADNAADSV